MRTLSLHSPRTATLDGLRSERASALAQLAGIAAFAALAALGAQVKLYPPGWLVPISLQTLAVYGAGLFLGARNGALSMALYLALGLVWPVFAGEGYGLSYLATTASAGYLLSYPLAALAIGAASRRWNTLAGSPLAVLAGSAVVFTCGVAWLHVAAGHATWAQSVEAGWLRFVVWDLVKVALVGGLYAGARRFF